MLRCPVCSKPALFWRQARDLHYGNQGVWDVYRCPNCRHMFQYPMSDEACLLQYYPSTYYSFRPPATDVAPKGLRHRGVWLTLHYLKYFRGYEHLPVYRNAVLAYVWRYYPKKPLHFGLPSYEPGGAFLDYGSGSGNTVGFAQFIGWEAEGIEINMGAAQAGNAAGLKIKQGSIDTLERNCERYDYIMSCHCVEHVPEVRRLFRAFFKALKPGKALAIEVPNADALAIQRYGEFYYYLCMPVHFHIFSPQSIRLLAEEVGFTDVVVASYSRWYTQAEAAILQARARHNRDCQTARYKSYTKWEGILGRLRSLPTYVRSQSPHLGDCLVMTCQKPAAVVQ